ncbi:hypothetical protein K435DRAFT_862947 [Dendrothele bispora CBS 962.96]|uniref:Uncharacterized protein n=1 Tax=Dendrothele bispora (strain CBS 962.96) TaxID=1314807 RepID=A0A4S8LR49_DENBC|nr:hypothetical protein K435DRAFT_862947 [Dendrothele bispora CBS 962.96]
MRFLTYLILQDYPRNTPSGSSSASGSTVHIQHDELPEPPAKRRRGLAGSIVSTALSAALIGTAVGLTVYRLWRDRGKEPPQLAIPPATSSPDSSDVNSNPNGNAGAPPPPYSSIDSSKSSVLNTLPPTPRRKTHAHTHSVHSSASKRRHAAHPRGRTYQYGLPSSSGPGSSSTTSSSNGATPLFPPTQPQFDFSFGRSNSNFGAQGGQQGNGGNGGNGGEEEDPDLGDQMDWIGNKLSFLIEEGKKALGREVVVMSESREDEDGGEREGWVDEDEHGFDGDDGGSVYSRSESPRRRVKKRRAYTPNGSSSRRTHTPSSSHGGGGIGLMPGLLGSGSAPPSASYSTTSFGFSTRSSSTSASFQPSTPVSINANQSNVMAFGETAGWESPELRESMERARARVKGKMGMRG